MPIYEYECVKCKHKYEKIFLSSKAVEEYEKDIKSPCCKSKAEKQISKNSPTKFLGAGFHVNDYR